jgi:hypothetical protein
MNWRHQLAAVLLLSVGVGCSSSGTSEPQGARERGPTFVSYDGRSLDAGLSTRFATRHLGDRWLVLQIAMISRSGVLEIQRDAIEVRDPEGNRLPLISREEFQASYSQFRAAIRDSDVSSPDPWAEEAPFDRCSWFFVHPSRGLSRDVVYLNPQRECSGPLVFQVPGGVQPGRWILAIDLEEDAVRIPFILRD